MTDLATRTARLALVALLAGAPVAAFAQSGTPQESVDADAEEAVVDGEIDCSVVSDDAKADGEDTGCAEAGAVSTSGDDDSDGTTDGDNEGSMVDEDAKNDG